MPYIITEPCIGVKDAACVDACPVDCIHPTPEEDGFESAKHLYIDPEECIDCGACEPACPPAAIFSEDDLPEKYDGYREVNELYYTQNVDAAEKKRVELFGE